MEILINYEKGKQASRNKRTQAKRDELKPFLLNTLELLDYLGRPRSVYGKWGHMGVIAAQLATMLYESVYTGPLWNEDVDYPILVDRADMKMIKDCLRDAGHSDLSKKLEGIYPVYRPAVERAGVSM
jgi:hypothetical protein